MRDAPRRVRRDHHPSNCWPPCTAEELSHRVDRHHGALVKLAPRADELARPCPSRRACRQLWPTQESRHPHDLGPLSARVGAEVVNKGAVVFGRGHGVSVGRSGHWRAEGRTWQVGSGGLG